MGGCRVQCRKSRRRSQVGSTHRLVDGRLQIWTGRQPRRSQLTADEPGLPSPILVLPVEIPMARRERVENQEIVRLRNICEHLVDSIAEGSVLYVWTRVTKHRRTLRIFFQLPLVRKCSLMESSRSLRPLKHSRIQIGLNVTKIRPVEGSHLLLGTRFR